MPVPETYRRHAIAAGIFFIIATAFLFLGEVFYKPHISAPNALLTLPTARAAVTTGVLIEFTCVMAIPLVAVALYPVLSRVSVALAMGYVAFRLFEAAIFATMQIDRFFLLSLSQAHAETGPAGQEALTAIVKALVADNAWTGVSGPIYLMVFVAGMLMLNWMFWTSRLVPRWLAAWGLVTAMMMGALSITAQYVHVSDTVGLVIIAPLAIQEMVLAIWFIAKGFDHDALARLSRQPAR